MLVNPLDLDLWIENNWNVLFTGKHGVGKCLGKGTGVLMYDGSIKKVEDISSGDLLMGPDSKSRQVLSISSGRDQMFKVIPKKGNSYRVNSVHILSLKMCSNYGGFKKNEIVNLNIEDFLGKSKQFRTRALGWRTPINFSSKNVPFDPYFLGVWLGDGTSSGLGITSIDQEIKDYIYTFSESLNLNVNMSKQKNRTQTFTITAGRGKGIKKHGRNVLRNMFKELDLFGNKHVPDIYKINDRRVRLEVLAGLIDTDGSLSQKCYDIITKSEKLADDICFLARSLGFSAYKKECKKYCYYKGKKRTGLYYRITISGNTDEIPVKIPYKKSESRLQEKDVLKTHLDVMSDGEGEYYGFTIDGDGLFVLEDFTVTHNTAIIIEAFNKHKLNWMYFSASTMDPWVDFIGVPKEMGENGKTYLGLLRPERFQKDEVEALFFDEYNRCLTGDTFVQLADGYSVKIKDLIGKDHFYVYSYDIKNKKIAIGKGHSAKKTGVKQKILKITLDNGMSVRCTPNHPFLLTTKEYIEAKDLHINDSLMALYKKYNCNGYELVSSFRPTKWHYTYILSDEYNQENNLCAVNTGKEIHRHHVDKNRFNNSPENIVRLSRGEHIRSHSSDGGIAVHVKHKDLYERTIGNEETRKIAQKNSASVRQADINFKIKRSKISKEYWNDNEKQKQSETTKKAWKNGQFDDIDRFDSNRKSRMTYTIKCLKQYLKKDENLTIELYETIRQRVMRENSERRGKGIYKISTLEKHFGSFDNFLEHFKSNISKVMNHRVVSIEEDGVEDVYDITVDNYHNFAIGQGIFVHNSHKKVRNAVMELIQFKSINGKKFNNLRVVWAAVNPEEDEADIESLKYDVEPLDPAQKDRFHIQIDIPYKCDPTYFTSKYGDDWSSASINWWDKLDASIKNLVSPRRLDYALAIHQKGGNMRHVLPKEANVTLLVNKLAIGNLQKFIVELKNDIVKSEKWLGVRANFDMARKELMKEDNFGFFLPFFPKEEIANYLLDVTKVGKEFRKKFLKEDFLKANPPMRSIISDVLNANRKNNNLGYKNIKTQLEKFKEESKLIPRECVGFSTFLKNTKDKMEKRISYVSSLSTIQTIQPALDYYDKSPKMTQYRKRFLELLVHGFTFKISEKECTLLLDNLFDTVKSFQQDTIDKCENLSIAFILVMKAIEINNYGNSLEILHMDMNNLDKGDKIKFKALMLEQLKVSEFDVDRFMVAESLK